MKKFRMTENWRLAAILIPSVVVLVLVFNFIILPQIQTWVMDQIPGSKPVYRALLTEYPQDKVSITSNTSQGILTISVGGKSLPDPNQLAKLEKLVCTNLGQNAQKYSNIYLQTSVVHQFLIFNSSQGESHKISCQ